MDNRITQAELIEMFGDTIPIEAIDIIWNGDPDRGPDKLREELRFIAPSWKLEQLLTKLLEAETPEDQYAIKVELNQMYGAIRPEPHMTETRQPVIVVWDKDGKFFQNWTADYLGDGIRHGINIAEQINGSYQIVP